MDAFLNGGHSKSLKLILYVTIFIVCMIINGWTTDVNIPCCIHSKLPLEQVYIAYYTSKSGIWLVISRVASYFHEPKASANTAYE